ncbi:response regulator transcription factor [Chitinophaga varians]|uniref:response regulator transcription factor n=1 Tax=Chitinophaga varians TaxID=2202339 RepID=UPI00165EFF46|nr:response regulator transcription factor [Chitinophaga varians]MBC9914472.1 response regulator transcription factor [Chitinophaga varians]
MTARIINIAIVLTQSLFRKVLKKYLSEQKNINVVINASSVIELLNNFKHFPVDVLLIDMSAVTADEQVISLLNDHPQTKILAYSDIFDIQLLNMLPVEIHGCISDTDDPDDLLQAITSVSNNVIHRNKLYTEMLYLNQQNYFRNGQQKFNVNLNDRERKIIQLLWEEKSNKEIADHFFLSTRSIEKIRQDLKDKLEVKSTVGIFKYALREKII